ADVNNRVAYKDNYSLVAAVNSMENDPIEVVNDYRQLHGSSSHGSSQRINPAAEDGAGENWLRGVLWILMINPHRSLQDTRTGNSRVQAENTVTKDSENTVKETKLIYSCQLDHLSYYTLQGTEETDDENLSGPEVTRSFVDSYDKSS
nr:hypothetical protein [Tanacetum cinerariifolium]